MYYPDIERDLEARFIKGFRRIFEFDNEFMYNVIEDKTNVIITPEFPVKEEPFKAPHIVVTNIGFQSDSGLGFNNNFYEDVAMNGIRNYASKYVAQVPYSVTMVCLGEYDISRNLANRVFFYTKFRAYNYLSGNLQLNISNVVKSPTSPKEQYPEKIFQTPVSVQGMLTLEVVETPFNYLDGNVSQPIDKQGRSFTDIKVSIDNK